MKKNIQDILFVALGFVIASALYANVMLFTLTDAGFFQSNDSQVNTFTQKETEAQTRITRSVPLVALNQQSQEGVIGNVTVRLIPGNANVLVQTNPFIGTDLQYSTNNAVTIAKLKTNAPTNNHDYILNYETPQSQVLGGGSAGAATTIALIAALTDQQINETAVVTGTIEPDSSIGNVGGIFEKAKAVAQAGFETFYVPEGQTTLYYYQRGPQRFQIKRQSIDLTTYAQEQWNLSVEEVGSIDELKKKMIY